MNAADDLTSLTAARSRPGEPERDRVSTGPKDVTNGAPTSVAARASWR